MRKMFAALVMAAAVSAPAARAAEEETLRVLLSRVPAQYVQPVTAEQTAVWFLKGISQLDEYLRVGDDRDKVSLYYRGMPVKSLYKPEAADDAEGWAELCGTVLDLAFERSEAARNRDFEAVDLMMGAAIGNFDKDSKYYPGLEPEREHAAHRRNFGSRMENDNLFLKIGAFNDFTRDEIVKAAGEHPEAKGLILDLRGSPGGRLAAAVEIADLFLDEGIVVSVRGRDENEITYYNSVDGDIAGGKPMAVLIDGGTASAAEVLAAALQEQSRAKVAGTRSFGKGTVQTLIRLPNGGTLSLSSAHFFTPSGRRIAGEGVLPDICTCEMPEGKDPDRLIAAGRDENCCREERGDGALESEIAAKLLKI